jgi:hypothetical protein
VVFISRACRSRGLLPIQANQALDHEQVHVARGVMCLELCAGLRCRARMYDDFDLWITSRNNHVSRITVIGTTGSDLTYLVFDLVD